MPPAIVAAGIGAAGAIGGAVLSSSAQKKASSQANAAQQQATDAQLQLGRESMALNKDIYNSNYNTLSPFVSRGNVAGNAINALLGLPDAPAMQSPLGGTAMATGTVPAPVQHNPVVSQTPVNPFVPTGITAPSPTVHGGGLMSGLGGIGQGRTDLGLPTIGPNALGSQTTAGAGGANLGGSYQLPGGQTVTPHTPTSTTTASPAPTTGTTAPSAYNAFQDFANSAGMQFQQEQAANALNNLYAAHGQLQSGAAMKAIPEYLQRQALNNYFMPYMGLLGGQQAVGAGAASSIAGVGQNFANSAANINSQMGANIGQGADAAAQNAYNRGAANAGMYGQIGSALGGLASSFFPAGGGGGGGGIVSNYHYTGSFGGY
jgi:hypothetical protein